MTSPGFPSPPRSLAGTAMLTVAADHEQPVSAPNAGAAPPAPVEERLDFAAAMERLPGGARRVFVLHDVEGYKHEEIAGMLGVTVGTSKAQLHRARMALRRHLVR